MINFSKLGFALLLIVLATIVPDLGARAAGFQAAAPDGRAQPALVTPVVSSTSSVNPSAATVASTTALTVSLNPATFGQTLTFIATVAGSGGTPTGTVTFQDGSTTIGNATLSAGTARIATAALGGGAHMLTAIYSGDGTFKSSTSAALTETINRAASMVAVVSSANPSTVGQSVTFTATVTGPGGTPTGSVTFEDDSSGVGTVTLVNGTASFTSSALAQGTHTITAAFGGSANLLSSVSPALSQVVNPKSAPAATTTSLTAVPNPAAFGTPVTFTATVTGTGGTPTGTVTFRDGATTLAIATLTAAAASYTTSALAPGSHAIGATYSGDTNFAGSVGSLTQTVDNADAVPGQTYTYQSTLGTTGVALPDDSHFSSPVAATVDSTHGHLFIADPGNQRVQVLDTGTLGVVATIGTAGTSGSDNLHFSGPKGVGFDPASNHVFVADSGNDRIQIFDATSFAYVSTLGSTGITGTDNAHFNAPSSAFVNAATGQLYVADTGNQRVQILDTATLAYVGTLGTGGSAGSDNAHFNAPADAELNPTANEILVADSGNARVQRFDAASFAYRGTLGGAGLGIGAPDYIGMPVTAAYDPTTNLVLVADDSADQRVEVFDALSYIYVLTLGTTGTAGSGNSQFSGPAGIAVDAAHARIFIGDQRNDRVQVFSIAAPVNLAAVLPDSRSVQLGHPATIFASMLNAGAMALQGCQVALPVTAPAGLTLSYQTTDSSTNALTGTPDTPATIPANNGVQSFLVTLQGSQAFSAPGMALDFGCLGVAPAAVETGVDTVDLVMSATPVADIIVLAATSTGNGIVEIPAGGAGAFAIASSNVGAASLILASVDTGSATLPLTATICQSNASTGQCLATPSASVQLSFATGATPTFSVFLQASGAIPLDPANARVFVRFKDANGGLHGSTSVAVATQ